MAGDSKTPRTSEPGGSGAPVQSVTSPAADHGRLRALDGLRLIAALLVAGYHLGGRNGEISVAWGSSPAVQFPTLSQVLTYGSLGVQLFFVISGFVICMSGWGRTLRGFVASRFARLMPAYWVAVLLTTAVFALPWVVFEGAPPSDVLVNLTMLQEPAGADRVLGVCWTLWVELRFYLLFALCVVLPGATRQRVVLFCAGWTFVAVLARASDWEPLSLLALPDHAPFFIGGMGLYLLHRYGPRDTIAWVIVLVSWLLGQYFAVAGLWRPADEAGFAYRHASVIIAVVTVSFLLVAAVALGRLPRWAARRWLTTLGALTYPFYLVHEHLGWVAVRFLYRGFEVPSWLVLPITMVGLLLLAQLLHRLVERPLTPRLKRALAAAPEK